jgi:hypothetical protein
MKKLIFAVMSAFTLISCTKDSSILRITDNPNWVTSATNSYGRDTVTGNLSVTNSWPTTNQLMVGSWTIKNIGTTFDTISVAEMTVSVSNGLSLSDITALGFTSSTGTSSMAWGAVISPVVRLVNLFPPPPHNTFYVGVKPFTITEDQFSIMALIRLRTGVQSGSIKIGLRMFNPRTNDYTTVNPVWGLSVNLIP